MVRDEAHASGDYTGQEWRWTSLSSTAHREHRRYWHGVRARVRDVLARGETPEPTMTRHSVLWDMS
jgi:hypothetical protein